MKKLYIYSFIVLCTTIEACYANSCQPCNKAPSTPIASPISTSESTFGMIKPDAIQAQHSGDIIKIIEYNGFRIKNMRKRTLSKQEAERFYAEHKGKPFFDSLVSYITSGPIIGLELEKKDAVSDWRALIGSTDPAQANIGTLRKMFATSKSQNAVHGSDSKESAQRELTFFFS